MEAEVLESKTKMKMKMKIKMKMKDYTDKYKLYIKN